MKPKLTKISFADPNERVSRVNHFKHIILGTLFVLIFARTNFSRIFAQPWICAKICTKYLNVESRCAKINPRENFQTEYF